MEKKRHILIVDDDEKIRRVIESYAKFENFRVSQAQDGIQAINFCRNNRCDVVTMDVVMPRLDGFTACKEIRKTSDVPIIMVSARSDHFDQIHGFEVGADDYIVKPFSPRILFLKIDAILKRVNLSTIKHSTLSIDDLEIDFTSRIVKIGGEVVKLAPKEYDILFYLIKNRGTVIKRKVLITRIWGGEVSTEANRTLDAHMKLLRKALGAYGEKITTLWGVGYRFDV